MRGNRIPWETPHRRVHPLTPVARGVIFVLFGLGLAQDQILSGDLGLLGGLVLGSTLLGLAYGATGWWLTKWWLTPYELRIDSGVLHRTSRRIRIDRIQEIDLVAPVGARLFGLAEVRLDVAGTQDSDGLAFLGRAQAQEVKEMLLARQQLVGGDVAESPAGVEARDADPTLAPGAAPVTAETELARVPVTRQVAMLATSLSSLLLLVGAPVLWWLQRDGHTVALAVAVPVVGALAMIVSRDLNENWRFRLTEDHLGLHVRRGLTNTSHQTISRQRLQGLVIKEPWVWRLAGLAQLDVATAGSLGVGKTGPDASRVLSVGDRALVEQLAGRLLGVPLEALDFRPAPRRAWLVAPLTAHALAYAEHDLVVAARGGVLVRRTHLVPHARVQSVQLRQGPLQRRLGLATLLVDSPEGPVRLTARHRSVAEARELLDREIEQSRSARRTRDPATSDATPQPAPATPQPAPATPQPA